MGTYASLNGGWERTLTQEEVAQFEKHLETDALDEISVEPDGSYHFSDSCGYSFFAQVEKSIDEFSDKLKIDGSYTLECEEDRPDAEDVFVGSAGYVKRKNYQRAKLEMEQAKNRLQALAANVIEAEIARWILEE